MQPTPVLAPPCSELVPMSEDVAAGTALPLAEGVAAGAGGAREGLRGRGKGVVDQ